MSIYKYIADIDRLTFENTVVIPCLNDEGYKTILIKNSEKKSHISSYSTKHLLIKRNVVLINDEYEYHCHVISCKESTTFMNNNFDVLYEYLFKKLDMPIDEFEFSNIIISIEELFTKNTVNVEKTQIGIAGELLTLLYFYVNGYKEIFDVYHKNVFSRHDIEFNTKVKLEVKTTVSEKRIHHFSHSQLRNKNFDIFISSVKLIRVEKGDTLYDLFMQMIDISKNYETRFWMHKLMNFCCVDNLNQGITFSIDSSLDNICLLRAEDIPQIGIDQISGVSNISYDSDCEFARKVSIRDFLSVLID